jgi:hypothetical protein
MFDISIYYPYLCSKIKNMKNLLKIMGALVGILIWFELIKFAFHLMNQPNTLLLYCGLSLLTLCVIGPGVITYFTLKNKK